MKYYLGVIFCLLISVPTWGQELYSVIAENGLIVRNKPNLNAQQIGEFYEGETN